jgi:hypothetical protein
VNEVLRTFYNYPPFAFPVVILDLGQVTVRGTYDQIKANYKAYSKMSRYLAIADGLQLEGTGATLTGTYNLSVVGFIRGKKIAPPIGDAAGAAPAAGGIPGLPPGVTPFGGPGGPPPGAVGAGGPPPGAAGAGR